MVRFSGFALMALGLVHLFVLGIDLPAELPRWLSLNLWTFDHWQPVRTQAVDLALSGSVFWATVGSFAVPAIILGGLVVWLDRRGLPVPAFVGWALVGWTTLASLIMLPSGFPVALLLAVLFATALTRRRAV